jgi:riboflavin synthase
MFTGIVEEVGEVLSLTSAGEAARLIVRGPAVVADVGVGESIAVDGCCLTVVAHDDDTFTADVVPESLARTALGELVPGAPVNLERAMTVGGRLGGHIVQGHVDGVGTVLDRTAGDRCEVVRIAVPRDLSPYLAVKGSVTVDGTSLTVIDTDDTEPSFTVALIPTTLTATTLGRLRVGTPVNLELDILAKYVERLLARTVATKECP